MTAKVTIPPEYDMLNILDRVKKTASDALYERGELNVDGILQSELEVAVAAYEYDHDTIVLAKAKSDAKTAIDLAAGNARERYITVAVGQSLTYQEKSEEAADFVAAGYPADLSEFPFLQAEVDATSKTPTAAANDILAQKAAWIAIGAQIERFRLSGKKDVDDAINITAVEAERDAAIANLNGV